MKFLCKTQLSQSPYFFISDIVPENCKIKSYKLKDDKDKLHELEKKVSIFNSSSCIFDTHILLMIYTILSDLCVEETAREYFSQRASSIACQQANNSEPEYQI